MANTKNRKERLDAKVDTYRCTGGKFYPLGNETGEVLVLQSFRNIVQTLPEEMTRVLGGCKEFKIVEEHARDYLRIWKRRMLARPGQSPVRQLVYFFTRQAVAHGGELPLSEKEVRKVRIILEECIERGFLVSKEELLKNIAESLPAGNIPDNSEQTIRILGIPTRNRKELLSRCVKSYLKNGKLHNRPCILHIADDSDHEAEAEQNQKAVKELCKRNNTPFLWAGRHFRDSLAREIAKESGVPPEVTRFALLGDRRCEIRTGACRNALLLLAAGKPSVQVDDDTICRILVSPWYREGVALSSESDCNQYRFYTIRQDGSELVTEQKRAFFSLHEDLLGKQAGHIIRSTSVLNMNNLENLPGVELSNLNIDSMADGFPEKLTRPDFRIAVTYTGALGDSGLSRHWWRLFFLKGDSYQNLIGNPLSYPDVIRSRQQLRVAAQTTLSDGSFYMPMCIGLDTREMLPPFTPIQRNQDGPFSQLLSMGFKGVCRGYSPYAIVHQPGGRPVLENRSKALAVGPYRVPDILNTLVWSSKQWPFGEDPVSNIQTVGHYLSDLCRLPPKHFKSEVHEICLQAVQGRMAYIQSCLRERFEAPEFWHKDAVQVLSNFQELIQQKNLCIPCDLPGSASERFSLFQELVGRFGQLLIHWPVIWQAAAELNKTQKMERMVV